MNIFTFSHVIVVTLSCLLSFNLFADAECEKRRPQNPHHFQLEEHKIREQWHDAYVQCKKLVKEKNRKEARNPLRVLAKPFSKKKQDALRVFINPLKTKNDVQQQLIKNAIIQAYERGKICQSDAWMKPQRFTEVFEASQIIHEALKNQPDLESVLNQHRSEFAQYEEQFKNDDAEIMLNANATEYEEYLAEQAVHQQQGLSQYVVFSIANFTREVDLLTNFYAAKREELKSEYMQENYLRQKFEGHSKYLKSLRNNLSSFLHDSGLFILPEIIQDLEIIFTLDNFNGDFPHVIALNQLLEQIKILRAEQGSHDLNQIAPMLKAAKKHFSEPSAHLYLQQRLDDYAASLDAMTSVMSSLWKDRIQDGYHHSLDEFLELNDPYEQFLYVQEITKVGEREERDCPICWEEKYLLSACVNPEHQLCASCFNKNVAVQFSDNSKTISCPFKDCTNTQDHIDYESTLRKGIFAYEFFETYKMLWLRQAGLNKNLARCAMGCAYFHDIPGDKIPGQSSPLCPDCQRKTCLSCQNLAHTGSRDCKGPDAEAMKKAHEEMFEQGYRDCPACGTWAIKVSGCDHVTCACGHSYSYDSSAKSWRLKHAHIFGYGHNKDL